MLSNTENMIEVPRQNSLISPRYCQHAIILMTHVFAHKSAIMIDISSTLKIATIEQVNYVCKYASLYTRKCIAPHKSPDQPAASARPWWPLLARPPPRPIPHHLLLYSLTRCPTCDDRRYPATVPRRREKRSIAHRPATSRRAAKKRRCIAFRGVSRGNAPHNGTDWCGRGWWVEEKTGTPFRAVVFWPSRILRRTMENKYCDG